MGYSLRRIPEVLPAFVYPYKNLNLSLVLHKVNALRKGKLSHGKLPKLLHSDRNPGVQPLGTFEVLTRLGARMELRSAEQIP